MSFPRSRYLSQQFVEELCAAKGVSDGLVDEIERAIFESHSQTLTITKHIPGHDKPIVMVFERK